ncbi:MAG: S41 family peptidase [Vicinamibacteraceae bacterium]
MTDRTALDIEINKEEQAGLLDVNDAQRRAVFEKVLQTVDKQFMGPAPDTRKLREEHEADILRSDGADRFEEAMSRMLRSLGTSHTGFFHESRPRSAGRVALAATFTKTDTADGVRWVFQDVHPGGVTAAAGIRPGDILLAVDDKDVAPPEATPFTLGRSYTLTIRRADGSTVRPTLAVPGSREKQRPIIVPDVVVTASKISADIGVIRVSMFPGVLGMDVARDISRAISDLGCSRLIIDLRGNTGGGIGCLRLMSHLCPDSRGVGYSIGRSRARKGYDKERLPKFNRIPSSKLGVLPLMLKFALAGRSVAVFTEGLGGQIHHGRVVLLANQHSASAAEMVAAFASEYKLATLVGVKTAGRLVATSAFKVGHGYRVVLPVATYFTWHDNNLEGRGVVPDVEEPLSADALRAGEDTQLQRARACLAEGS